MGNACRYARTTVEVTVRTVRHEDGDTVVFEVRDDGALHFADTASGACAVGRLPSAASDGGSFSLGR
jgi:hypothetical protein